MEFQIVRDSRSLLLRLNEREWTDEVYRRSIVLHLETIKFHMYVRKIRFARYAPGKWRYVSAMHPHSIDVPRGASVKVETFLNSSQDTRSILHWS